MAFLSDLKEFTSSALAFIFDKEARELSPIKYPSGAGMSVREAKRFGLYVDGKPLTPAYINHLQQLAMNGTEKDRAIFVAAKWNLSAPGNQLVRYKKSDIEGDVVIATVGPAHIKEDTVLIPLEKVGDVMLGKIELLQAAKLVSHNT